MASSRPEHDEFSRHPGGPAALSLLAIAVVVRLVALVLAVVAAGSAADEVAAAVEEAADADEELDPSEVSVGMVAMALTALVQYVAMPLWAITVLVSLACAVFGVVGSRGSSRASWIALIGLGLAIVEGVIAWFVAY